MDGLEIPLDVLGQAMAILFGTDSAKAPQFLSSLHDHRRCQSLFFSAAAATICRLANLLPSAPLTGLTALSYRVPKTTPETLRKLLKMSGDRGMLRADTLFSKAVERIALLLKEMDRTHNRSELLELLKNHNSFAS